MVTDQQVVLLRQRRMERKTQQTSAAMAGMSVRSAQKWQCGPLPSETGQERWWRTRTDPFDGVYGRRRPCPCSKARPPAGSGQRQLSNGWKRNSPAASAPPSSALCNDDYRTGELYLQGLGRQVPPFAFQTWEPQSYDDGVGNSMTRAATPESALDQLIHYMTEMQRQTDSQRINPEARKGMAQWTLHEFLEALPDSLDQ